MAIEEYLKLYGEYKTLDRKLNDTASTLGNAAGLLRQRKCIFSNCNVSGPPEMMMSSGPTIDANQWLTADQIQQLVVDIILLKKKLHSAWDKISSNERQGLQDPNSA